MLVLLSRFFSLMFTGRRFFISWVSFLAASGFALVRTACAETWTPLVASTDFDGIKADVITLSGGILAVLLVILGIGLIVKVLAR